MLTTTRRPASDAGVTLIELTMVVFFMGIFSVVAYQSLTSFIRISDVTQKRGFVLADARVALERMARNVRAANPIVALDPSAAVSTYENQISFFVYCSTPGVQGCGDNQLRPVVYTLSGNAIRQTIGGQDGVVLAPVGAASVPMHLRPGAVVNSASEPVFTYFDKRGDPIPTSGSPPPATRFRDCTKSVEIHLVVNSESGRTDKAIDLTTRVDLRNYQAVTGC
jgi:Tfp pilus assembly protein PilE